MDNVCQPLFAEGRNITGRVVTAPVVGKRCVAIASNGTDLPNVATASAGGRIFGVAAYDAAVAEAVPVLRKGIVPITASAPITANAEVEVAAGGQVATKTAGVAIGFAVFSAASGADAYICLYE